MQSNLINQDFSAQFQTTALHDLTYGPLEVIMPKSKHTEYLSQPYIDLGDGDIISMMPALPQPSFQLTQVQMQQAEVANQAMLQFWNALPLVLAKYPEILDILHAADPRLEADYVRNGQLPALPLMVKYDAILGANGQVFLIDPNEVPLGVAALHGVPAAIPLQDSACEFERVIESIRERVGLGHLTIITRPSRGLLNHKYMVNLLRDAGIDASLSYPEQIRYENGVLLDQNNFPISTVWQYVRYNENNYSDVEYTGIHSLLAAANDGAVDLINAPGTRVYGANLWSALIHQSTFSGYLQTIIGEAAVADLVLAFPYSMLLQIQEDELYELQWNGSGFSRQVYVQPAEFSGAQNKQIFLKTFGSSGAKGVFRSGRSANQIVNTANNFFNNNSIFIAQQRVVPFRPAGDEIDHKLEFWTVNGQMFASAIMVTAKGRLVHGGSNTYYNVY